MADTDSTIIFLDLVRFTSLTDTHGDQAAVDAADALVGVAHKVLDGNTYLVKTLGDGLLLRAPDPETGLSVATRIVHRLHDLGRGLDLRGGLAHGPAVVRERDVLGLTVNLASRIASMAQPGNFVVTRAVALQAGAVGLAVEPMGALNIDGLAEPVELFSIDVCEHDLHWITDPVCGMRLDPDHVTDWEPAPEGRVGFCSAECSAKYRASPQRFPH